MENGELKVKKDWEIKKQNLEGRTPSTCEVGGSPLQTSSLPQHALKAGWEIKKLGEVCEIRPSKNETIKFLKDDDNVTFFPMEDLQILNYYIEPKQLKKLKEVSGSYTCFANGDVLLAKVTPCFENGKLGIANNLENGVGFGSSEYIVFRPSNILLSEYLYYCLASPNFRENGKKHLLGACGLKRLSKDYVNEYEIPVPPLEEQKRIVKILDEKFTQLETIKAASQTNLQNAKDLFQSQLAKAFVFPQGNTNTTWEKKRLGDFSEITDGDHLPPPKSPRGFPFITISNIDKDSHTINFTDTFYVPETYFANLKENRKPKKGDVLYTVTGSYGIPVIVDGSVEFCFQRHIGLIRPNSEINSNYLYYWILSPEAKKIADDVATGTAQKTVSLSSLRNFEVPLPPLPEQKCIVKELDTLSEKVKALQNIYEQMLLDCEELKQSFLCKAFAGEL